MPTPRPAIIDMLWPELEAELQRVVGPQKSPLYLMLRYHLGWNDQTGAPEHHAAPDRVMGALCLLSVQAAGAQAQQALPAAVAIELAQAFAAIHADAADNRPAGGVAEGLGRSPVWWVWGNSQGINAGDAMYAQARLAVMGLEQRGVRPELLVRATTELDRACLELCERRYAAIEQEAKGRRTPESYLETIEGTAGALAGAAGAMGALAAGAANGVVDGLRRFGRAAGVAAHLRQEIDALWPARSFSAGPGRVRQAGLTTGVGAQGLAEALDRRRSLPLAFAFNAATGAAKSRLEAAARRDILLTDAVLTELAGIIEGTGARRYAEDVIDLQLGAASQVLSGTGISGQALDEYARYLAGR